MKDKNKGASEKKPLNWFKIKLICYGLSLLCDVIVYAWMGFDLPKGGIVVPILIAFAIVFMITPHYARTQMFFNALDSLGGEKE